MTNALIEQLSLILESHGMMLATAESCTGGMIAAAITDRPGSSAIFERGFITYSNQSKSELLDISEALIEEHGAVSAATAAAMARGALNRSTADISLAITGIAGPGGGTAEKPVGLVYIACAARDSDTVQFEEHRFKGDRAAIRQHSVESALKLLLKFLDALT